MKRKSLVFLLAVVMMMSCISVPAFATADENAASEIKSTEKADVQKTTENNDNDINEDINSKENDSIIKDDIMQDIDEIDSEEAVKKDIEEDTQIDATEESSKEEKAKDANESDNGLKAPVLEKRMQSTHRVLLKWNKVKGAKGYLIYKNDQSKAFKKIGKKKTKYLMKNVKPGKTNKYVVKAYKIKNGKELIGKASNKLKIKTPKVLKQSSKYFKETNAYKVIKAAKTKLGCAYVSGAAGPRAFDCSGYTYYVYNKMNSVKKIGTKRFTRSSAQGNYNALKKYNIGRDISKAQPGDIMLFSHSGRPGNIHHAALYYGNGKIIHASSPSTGVLISRIAFRKVAAIIRLPKM